MTTLFDPQIMTALGIYSVLIGAIIATMKLLKTGKKSRQEETEQFMNSPNGCATKQAACKEKLEEVKTHLHKLDISMVKIEEAVKRVNPNGKLDQIIGQLSNINQLGPATTRQPEQRQKDNG